MREDVMPLTVCCKKKDQAKLENKILLNFFPQYRQMVILITEFCCSEF